jgi:acyl-CoA thioesterase FadM
LQTGKLITIKTKLDMPKVAKLTFNHIITASDNIKYAEGTTTVAMVSKSNGLLTELDDNIKALIKIYLA